MIFIQWLQFKPKGWMSTLASFHLSFNCSTWMTNIYSLDLEAFLLPLESNSFFFFLLIFFFFCFCWLCYLLKWFNKIRMMIKQRIKRNESYISTPIKIQIYSSTSKKNVNHICEITFIIFLLYITFSPTFMKQKLHHHYYSFNSPLLHIDAIIETLLSL